MESLLSIGLTNALVAVVLALLAFVVDRIFRRPAISHCFWLLVLLKLVTPPLVRVPLPWPAEPAKPAALLPEDMSAVEIPVTPLPPPAPFLRAPPVEVEVPADVQELPVNVPGPPAAAISWPALAFAVWFSGSVLWWTVAAIRMARFGRLLRQTQEAPGAVRERVRQLAGLLGLRRCPNVAFMPGTVSPLLWAPGRTARLLVPRELWERLDDDQRDSLLVHELAHLRRRDHCVRRLELVALGLYWWHPVAWWARRELQDAEERCCDGWVAKALPGSGAAYAAALVETVAFLSATRPVLPLGSSGGGQARHIKRRLTMILEGKTARPLGRRALVVVLAVGAVLLALAPGGAKPPPAASTATEPTVNLFDSQHFVPAAADAEEPSPAQKVKQSRGDLDQDSPVEPKAPLFHPPQPGRLLAQGDQFVQQAEARRAVALQKLTAANNALRVRRTEEAREEIERLEVQLRIKQARVKAAMLVVKVKNEVLRRMEVLGRIATVSDEDVTKARVELMEAEAEAAVRQAELGEPEVLLKQARRRLGALEASPEEKKDAKPADLRQLNEVEKKVDDLRREIESLRKELRPQGSALPFPGGKGAVLTAFTSGGPTRRHADPSSGSKGTAIYTPHPSMNFQFVIRPELRDKAKTVSLFVSNDDGKTWKEGACVGPDFPGLQFNAPRDGRYLLS
jgi:bla regulator protein BlaR1